MLACFDVDYRPSGAKAACVGFGAWADAAPSFERARYSHAAASPYVPGEFYRRELPHLLALLAELPASPALVIIDGHVWLDGARPGLGARLYEALEGAIPVIGVAKRAYRQATRAVPVQRGQSQQLLYVSAVGTDALEAANHVQNMHGAHRIPTLLKRVDRLSREP